MWRAAVRRRALPHVNCKAFSQSATPTGLDKPPKSPKPRRQQSPQKPALVKSEVKLLLNSRPNNSTSVLNLRSASTSYLPEETEETVSQPSMGKKKNKTGRARPAAPPSALAGEPARSRYEFRASTLAWEPEPRPEPFHSTRYPLRSQNSPAQEDPSYQGLAALVTANGNQQPQNNGSMGPSGFNQGAVYQTPLMPNGISPFSMAPSQPNLFSGLQAMQMPFFTQNMGFGTSLPSLFSDQRFLNSSQSSQTGIPMPNSQEFQPPSSSAYNTGTVTLPARPSTKSEGKRPIQTPSEASGGIPEASPAYIMRASLMPKRRDHAGPLLVVIDLNGTLLHRPDRRQSANFQGRQNAGPFAKYCIETFWVVIWSSARPENVKRMVNGLLTPESLKQVVAVWGRDRFGLTEADYNARTQCYKRLTTVWDDPLVRSSYPRARPGFEGGCWNQGNTVLIDDSAEKARSEPFNAITLPEFTGGVDVAVDVLPKVHDYLNELCYQEDVSAYMRANPFKMA